MVLVHYDIILNRSDYSAVLCLLYKYTQGTKATNTRTHTHTNQSKNMMQLSVKKDFLSITWDFLHCCKSSLMTLFVPQTYYAQIHSKNNFYIQQCTSTLLAYDSKATDSIYNSQCVICMRLVLGTNEVFLRKIHHRAYRKQV